MTVLHPDVVKLATETICFGHAHSPSLIPECADRQITGGRPRLDALGLAPGPSIPLEDFERLFCKPRHGDEDHDILACVQTAYYERLERDEARLATLARKRGGPYGTRGSLQNASA